MNGERTDEFLRAAQTISWAVDNLQRAARGEPHDPALVRFAMTPPIFDLIEDIVAARGVPNAQTGITTPESDANAHADVETDFSPSTMESHT